MKLRTINSGIILMTASLATGIVVPSNLPDGRWRGQQLPDGTTITTSLNDPSLPPIIERHEMTHRRSSKEQTQNGECYGYFLDHSAVDLANADLQKSVGSGENYCTDNGNTWTGVVVNGVLVYFCEDHFPECINLTPGVIQDGMGYMDGICQPYEAGWALFPSSGGNGLFLMGKILRNLTTNICPP